MEVWHLVGDLTACPTIWQVVGVMYNLKAVKRFMNVFEKLKLKDVGLVNDHHKMKVCKILFAKKKYSFDICSTYSINFFRDVPSSIQKN